MIVITFCLLTWTLLDSAVVFPFFGARFLKISILWYNFLVIKRAVLYNAEPILQLDAPTIYAHYRCDWPVACTEACGNIKESHNLHTYVTLVT